MQPSEDVRITLVRHGESVANQVQRWQGQGDSPLSERGRAQAERVGARLAPLRDVGQRVRVLSSDLSRAVETARAIGLPFVQQRVFREFDVGVWEGLTRDEVESRYPEEIARLKAGEDIALGGGETYQEFAARVDAAFLALRRSAAPGEHVVLVCHGGVIGAVLGGLCGFRAERRFPLARLSNTSLTELAFRGDAATFRVFNDTHHLAHEAPWPEFADAVALVALSCGPGKELPGSASAEYDVDSALPGLPPDVDVASCVASLQARHPAERVALRTARAEGWRYLERTLWPGDATAPVQLDHDRPLRGHVGLVHGRLTVLDFGAYGP